MRGALEKLAMTDGYECYHCKQWIQTGDAHDCWTTTEAALTAELPDDLGEAWERLRETAAEFGEQRIYASHHSIMFSRKSCYFFVRPKRKFLEVCIFLDRPIHDPRVRRVERPSRTKVANVIRITHRDEVEAPFTDWLREAYDLFDRPRELRRGHDTPATGPGFASPSPERRSNLAKKGSTARKTGARKAGSRKTTRKTTSRKTAGRASTSRTSSSRKTGSRKSSAKRTAVKNRAGSFYAKRKSTGRFKEMDEKGRSLKTDRRRKARKTTKSGYGDQGDRRTSSKKR